MLSSDKLTHDFMYMSINADSRIYPTKKAYKSFINNDAVSDLNTTTWLCRVIS